MASFRQHLDTATIGFVGQMFAPLAIAASPFVGAAIGARLGWPHGWLPTIGGLLAGVPLGLLAGAAVATGAMVGSALYSAILGYTLDCFQAVDQGLRPKWLRLREPEGSESPAFPLWCLPFVVSLGSMPFGALLWTALLLLPRRRPHPAPLDVIAPTVTITFAITLAVVVALGTFLVLRRSQRARALWVRVKALEGLPPTKRPFLAMPIAFTLMTSPLVVLAMFASAALDFFTRSQRSITYPPGFHAAVFAFILAVLFLTACWMEARERWRLWRGKAVK